VEQYLQVTESVCVRGDAPETTVSIFDAMLRGVEAGRAAKKSGSSHRSVGVLRA
jgi:hypothetical protein